MNNGKLGPLAHLLILLTILAVHVKKLLVSPGFWTNSVPGSQNNTKRSVTHWKSGDAQGDSTSEGCWCQEACTDGVRDEDLMVGSVVPATSLAPMLITVPMEPSWGWIFYASPPLWYQCFFACAHWVFRLSDLFCQFSTTYALGTRFRQLRCHQYQCYCSRWGLFSS